MKYQKFTKRTAGAIAIGTSAALLATLAGCALCAWLVSAEMIPETAMGYCAPIVLLISSFTGGKVAIGRTQDMRLVMGGAVAVCYVLAMLAVTALFFNGMYQRVGITMLVAMGGGAVAAILGNRVKKMGISRKSKIKRR